MVFGTIISVLIFVLFLINNGGGGIFKIIDGPQKVKEKDQYFVTKQKADASRIAEAYGLEYHSANDITTLNGILKSRFYEPSDQAKLLEIFTAEDSDKVLKSYFQNLL